MKYPVRSAIPPAQNLSVNLVPLPAKHYTNVTIAKNRLIILSAIDDISIRKATFSAHTADAPAPVMNDVAD